MLHTKDKRGRTALMLAAANGHLDMVTLLVGQGADINASDKVRFYCKCQSWLLYFNCIII